MNRDDYPVVPGTWSARVPTWVSVQSGYTYRLSALKIISHDSRVDLLKYIRIDIEYS